MLGIEDFWVWLPYLLAVLSALLCVVYGSLMWNRGTEPVAREEDVQWAKDEDRVDEDL